MSCKKLDEYIHILRQRYVKMHPEHKKEIRVIPIVVYHGLDEREIPQDTASIYDPIDATGDPHPFISMFFSCSYLLSATGAFMGQRLNRFLGEKKMFLSLYIAIFITLLLLKVNTVFALTGLVILSPLFEGIHGPITAGFINHHTRSRIRATVNSITNFSRSLVTAIALPLFGLIAQYSIALIFFINAGLIFVGIFVVRIWYKKLPQKHYCLNKFSVIPEPTR